MKETELRIGNLIIFNDDNNTVCAIESIKRDFDDEPYSVEIKFKDGMFSDVNIEDIKPIALTEKWLKKFGFVKTGSMWHHNYYENFILTESENGFIFYFGGTPQGSIMNNVIKYVHRLQNAFILTGNELTIQEYSIK